LIYITSWSQEPIHDPKIQHTWKGKNVTYKQFRDSLDAYFYYFCDSVKKSRITTHL
jgi:hypothetical protein